MEKNIPGSTKLKLLSKIFKNNNSLENFFLSKTNYCFFGLLGVAFTFPLPYSISNLFLGLLIILWLLEGDFLEKIQIVKKNKILWLILGFYILFILSLLYTEDFREGLSILERKASLFILPLIIATIKIPKNYLKYIFFTFILGNLVTSIILLSRIVFLFFAQGECSNCFYHQFTAPIDLHAIFFSLFLLFSIYIIIFYYEAFNKIRPVFGIISVIILSIALIFSASKTLLISFLILLPLFLILKHINLFRDDKRSWIIIAMFFSLCFISILYLNPIKERFLNSLNTSSLKYLEIVGTDKQLNNTQKRELNGFTLRVLIAKLAFHKIFEEDAYILGYGPADVSNKLNEAYLKHNMAPNWFFNYNAHNQYIQIFLELGIIGLLYLLVILILALYSSIKGKNYLLAFFIILVSINFMTEVVLNRNKGIVFFAFFYALLLFNNRKLTS